MDPYPISNSSKTNRTIYDFDDENWVENRSKNLHDPLNLRNQSNKEVPESSKPKVAKTPQKGKEKQHPLFPDLHCLECSMKYVIKKVSTHALRFGAPFKTNFLEEFQKSIGDDVIEMFRATIFGPYLDIPKCNFQDQITKCLLLLELEQGNSRVLHIRHANGGILNFDIIILSFLSDITHIFSRSPNAFLNCSKNHVNEQSFSVSTTPYANGNMQPNYRTTHIILVNT
ncbi:hypothetical protein H5410_010431 [Solanum commersonii]|uniref:Uncharacterized protein n=1 Tax=Solanum commersonii TaxID=4109 RepID=A0A9J6AKP9_SOLCO|nr:hypothetical protein H5410_010431 [Solanum commersonii]